MTIAAVRAAIATALDTIASIETVCAQVTEAIPKLPVTIQSLERIRYHKTLDGCMTQGWRVLLLLAERDSKRGHDDLDPYLAPSGVDSIKATLEAASIADGATVNIAENIGFIEYKGQTFIGAEFIVEVTDTG